MSNTNKHVACTPKTFDKMAKWQKIKNKKMFLYSQWQGNQYCVEEPSVKMANMCCFSLLLWEKEQSPNPLCSRKQGWIPSSCHFGKGFWGATLKFTNAAPSMNARSLQAIPRCKGDKSTIKTIQSTIPIGFIKREICKAEYHPFAIHLPFCQKFLECKAHVYLCCSFHECRIITCYTSL